MARNLSQQEPGRGKRHATAACTRHIAREPARHHESADDYSGIVARLRVCLWAVCRHSAPSVGKRARDEVA